MGALRTGRLVEHEIGLGVTNPINALHRVVQPLGRPLGARIGHFAAVNGHPTLLDQSSTDPSGAKTLAVKNIVKPHCCHGDIVQ